MPTTPRPTGNSPPPLARPKSCKPRLAERCELYACGVERRDARRLHHPRRHHLPGGQRDRIGLSRLVPRRHGQPHFIRVSYLPRLRCELAETTMATNAHNRRLERCYKQHTAVDDKVGVILDVEVTAGQTNEGEMIEPQVDEVEATTGIDIKTVTADAGYAYAKVYGA